jgi:hypothetical protein
MAIPSDKVVMTRLEELETDWEETRLKPALGCLR